MTRLAASFVLGYHGCDATVASDIVNGRTPLLHSDKNWDWLGPGAYFWEADPDRAFEWATQAVARGRVQTPAVVGAVIDLGNCLDLLARSDVELVAQAYDLFAEERLQAGLKLPENKGVDGEAEDRVIRLLDCAVMRFLHERMDETDEKFDTTRGLFPEGEELYPNAGFRRRNHVQIAVRNMDAILGVFYPPGYRPGN